MQIEILTIFPNLFAEFLCTSLIGKALESGVVQIRPVDIRDFSDPPHHRVDDEIYGGGPGMLLKPEPLAAAICYSKKRLPEAPVIYLTPTGESFSQPIARELSCCKGMILICGRYEGIDHRIVERYVDREISIGPYILMGGEVATMAVLEAVTRLLPGGIGNPESLVDESFAEGSSLEAPHYTRPAEFEGVRVPDPLLSGDHRAIKEWRKAASLRRTQSKEE